MWKAKVLTSISQSVNVLEEVITKSSMHLYTGEILLFYIHLSSIHKYMNFFIDPEQTWWKY